MMTLVSSVHLDPSFSSSSQQVWNQNLWYWGEQLPRWHRCPLASGKGSPLLGVVVSKKWKAKLVHCSRAK